MEILLKRFRCLVDKKIDITMNKIAYLFLAVIIALYSCTENRDIKEELTQPVYQDIPYLQDYAIKYTAEAREITYKKVYTDRNDVIQVLTSKGIYRPTNGHFQYPGLLKPDKTYLPMADKQITDMGVHQHQFVYLDDVAVFSNAWAGKLFLRHQLSHASIVCAGERFNFLISDGTQLKFIVNSVAAWSTELAHELIRDIKFSSGGKFYILTHTSVYSFSGQNEELKIILSGSDFTSFELTSDNFIVIGTTKGYQVYDMEGLPVGKKMNKLPWTEITTVQELNGELWFGSMKGGGLLLKFLDLIYAQR